MIYYPAEAVVKPGVARLEVPIVSCPDAGACLARMAEVADASRLSGYLRRDV